jgi:prophage regulatory protein
VRHVAQDRKQIALSVNALSSLLYGRRFSTPTATFFRLFLAAKIAAMSSKLFAMVRPSGAMLCLGRGRTSLWADIKNGRLMPPVRLGPRAVGWPSHEIDTLVAARLVGCTDDEICGVVRRIVARRAELAQSMDAIGVD